MALTFVGFVQGEAVTTLDWSLLADGLGGDYDYHGDGFRPSAGLGAREVAISAGRTTGWGVQAILDAPYSLTLTDPGATTRAWMVVVERDWTTGTGSIKALDCGGSSRIPPSTLKYRGNGDQVDHQPICYAVVTSTSVQVVDLRMFAEKLRSVNSEEAILTSRTRVGQLYRTPDNRLLTAATSQTGAVVLNPAQKRFLIFNENEIQADRIGVNGELRIPWPYVLDWDPHISNAYIWSGPNPGNQLAIWPNYARLPNRREGNFIVRTLPNLGVPNGRLSRITVTLMEA